MNSSVVSDDAPMRASGYRSRDYDVAIIAGPYGISAGASTHPTSSSKPGPRKHAATELASSGIF